MKCAVNPRKVADKGALRPRYALGETPEVHLIYRPKEVRYHLRRVVSQEAPECQNP